MNHHKSDLGQDRQSPRLAKYGIFGVVALVLSGCQINEPIDLEKTRMENRDKDMATLKKVLPRIEFKEALSLQQVIVVALRNNLDLRVSEFNRLVADQDAVEAKLALLPDLTASADFTSRDSREISDAYNINTGQVQTASTISEPRDNITSSLRLSWDALDFGVGYYRAKQASKSAQGLVMQRRRQAQLLALEITEAYWKAALAEDALDHVQSIRAEVAEQHKVIEASMGDNLLRKDAALRLKRRLLDLQLSIHDLESEIATARIDLSRLMGLDQTSTFRLKREPVQPLLKSFVRPQDIDVDRLERFALLNRPELFEQDLNVAIQHDEAKARLLQQFPSLNASMGLNYDGNYLLHSQAWTNVAFGLSWNLLALPSRIAAYESQKRIIQMSEAERLQSTQAVLTQVHISALEYGIAADRFALFDEQFSLSTELLDITREQRQVGRATAIQVAQDLLQTMASKLRRDQAVVDLIVAQRRVLASVGLNPVLWKDRMQETGLVVVPGDDDSIKIMDGEDVVPDLPSVDAVDQGVKRPPEVEQGLGGLEKSSRAARVQGGRNAATETYQVDRRESEYRPTTQSDRSVGFSRSSLRSDASELRLKTVSSNHKQHSPEFKAKVALEALQETAKVSELAARHDVQPTQVNEWKGRLLKSLTGAFQHGSSEEKVGESEVDFLYRVIGQMTVERDFVSRKPNRRNVSSDEKKIGPTGHQVSLAR